MHVGFNTEVCTHVSGCGRLQRGQHVAGDLVLEWLGAAAAAPARDLARADQQPQRLGCVRGVAKVAPACQHGAFTPYMQESAWHSLNMILDHAEGIRLRLVSY